MKKLVFTGLIALALIPCSTAQAAVVAGDVLGIDFGGIDAGNTWNNISVGGSATTLGLDSDEQAVNPDTITIADLGRLSDGAATGVGFSILNSTGEIAWDFTGGADGDGGIISAAGSDVFGDGLISNDANGRTTTSNVDFFLVTFSGLDDALEYDFTAGFDNNNGNFDTTWNVYTDNTFTTAVSTFTTDTTGAASAGFGTLTDLTSSGGEIFLGLTGNGGAAQTVVSALTLTANAVAVPEPSSFALLGLGAFGAVARRRRR